MLYSSQPDTAVFVVNGHYHVAANLSWDEHGNGQLALTGEKLSDVMKRVDSAHFFRDGDKVKLTAAQSY